VALPVLLERGIRADEPVEPVLDRAEEPSRHARHAVDARHPDPERVAERDQRGRVDQELRDPLAAHLQVLPAEERVDEVRDHRDCHGEAEGVGGGHQTRSRTYRSRKATAKHATTIPSAARSYMAPP